MRWAALLMLVGSCLPEAGPGIGHQEIAGRGIAEVALPPAGPGALFTRFGPMPEGPEDGPDRTLFAVGPGAPRALAQQVPVSWAEGAWDARGRLLVGHHRTFHAGAPLMQLSRFDLAGGGEEHLGLVRAFQLSPDGRVLVLQRADGTVVARGSDEVDHPLGARLDRGRFVGPTLYFLDGTGLRRWQSPDAEVHTVVPGATDWYPIPGGEADGMLLAVVPFTSDVQMLALAWTNRPVALTRGIATGALRSAPAVSSDGARVAFLETDGDSEALRARLVDLRTDQERTAGLAVAETLDSSVPDLQVPDHPGTFNEIAFRPHSDEVWYLLAGRLRAIQRGDQVRATATRRLMLPRINGGPHPSVFSFAAAPGDDRSGSVFTADGQRWLYLDDDGHVYLGRSDDPDAPSAQALDLGVFRAFDVDSFRELAEGRWLVVHSSPTADRQDLAVVDLGAGTLRPLAQHLGPALSDGSRTVAIVDKVNEWWAPGTLASFDLAAGTATVLAHNVTQLALAPACAGCALTAPGARLLYVVQARVSQRYDGLWRATLP
jgi:hypothetical protein